MSSALLFFSSEPRVHLFILLTA